MKNICIVGHCALDFILEVSSFAEPDDLIIHPDSFVREFGGIAGNTAVILKKLGVNASICASLGHDLYGKIYMRRLKELGIDISHIKLIETSTAKSVIVVNINTRQISSYYFDGSSNYPPDLDSGWINTHDMIHLAESKTNTNLLFADSFKGEISFDLGLCINDISKSNLEKILSKVSILFLRERHLNKVFSLLDIDKNNFKELIKLGPNTIVRTMGKEGAMIYTKEEDYHIPAFVPYKKLGVSGAGDGFRAGFLAALIKGFNIKDSGYIAAIVASFVLKEQGAQTRIPSWKQAMKKYYKLKESDII